MQRFFSTAYSEDRILLEILFGKNVRAAETILVIWLLTMIIFLFMQKMHQKKLIL